ncbi:MAG: DUF4250 domain-containing protein [Lachnospiraceae bacterium]|nr:DUF4250 domain-containing protein [Lachnospiraceae bacterium]
MIPNDPMLLLSYVNTWLRDHDGGYEEFVKSHALSEEQGAAVKDKLLSVDYRWDEEQQRFV